MSLCLFCCSCFLCFFFFNDTATTEIYTLSLHDALPILRSLTSSFVAPAISIKIYFSPVKSFASLIFKPEKEITDQEIKDIIDTMENRLNVYGLSDLKIKEAKDLTGEKYILIEIAGATKEEVKDLIGSQGNFEAKIGNEVVFKGGKQDITFVCRNDGTCSRISQCNPSAGGFGCQFEFEISLSNDAAQKHAEITKNLEIITSEGGSRVLEKNIDFYLYGKQVDSLQISESLKGQKATRITISGQGLGVTEAEAINNAIKNRDKLKTVLITGSLPTKLEIIKLDYISPTIGKSFLNNAILVGI